MPNYLPSLSAIVSPENIPDNLGVVKDGIYSIFSNLYFDNLQVESSAEGDQALYNLSIFSYTKLSLGIPGTDGLALVLNPGFIDGNTTEFPITVGYSWRILKYVQAFNLASFDFLPRSFFDRLFNISGATDQEILITTIHNFFDSENDAKSQRTQFVDDFNTRHSPASPLVEISDPEESVVVDDLLEQLVTNGNNFDIKDIIFTDYILEGSSGDVTSRIESLFSDFLGNFTLEKDIKQLLLPKFSASLNNISLALEFPRSVLRPLDTEDNVIENEEVKSQLTFTAGALLYNTEDGLQFENLSSFSFNKSEIANTGLTLQFTNLKLDLSRTTTIPEASADGRPDDFVGVFIQQAEIGLPKSWTPDPDTSNIKILGRNLIIGTGGLSGTIGLDTGGNLKLIFGSGFKVQFDYFDLTFQQNSITASNIAGKLTIPGFKRADSDTEPAVIDISAGIKKGGDFHITAKFEGGFPIKLPNIFTYTVSSLGVGKQSDRYYLETSGSLKLELGGGVLSGLIPSEIQLDRLIIYDDGAFEISGGSLVLREPIKLKLGTVTITVTAIHMGSYERNHSGRLRKYRYIGFDGGISINPGGIDARGDGIKLYFSVDDGPLDVFLRIQGIAVDIIIPGSASAATATAIIKGYIAMREPAPDDPDGSTEYIGGIDLSLPKIGLRASAAMRLSPATPAWIIDASLELPSPIPLAATGLGIYGFRGILGMRYVMAKKAANLPDSASWYEYYQAKVSPENQVGVTVGKMLRKSGFTLGAGLSLGTLDSGFTFSTKLTAVFYNSGLYIEGKMAFLKQRVGLDTQNDPPLFIILSITESDVELSIGAQMQIPKNSGAILDLYGVMEAKYYFNDAGAWYINVGREYPEQKRIRAKVLSLFDASSYFMISGQGIRAGASIDLDYDKTFGPLRVFAKFWLSMGGRISFDPLQLGGFISAGGQAGLYVFSFGFSLGVSLYLGAEAPRPFAVKGSASVSVGFKLFRKRREYSATIELTWIFNQDRDISEQTLLDYGKGVKAVNMLTGEIFPVKGLPYDLNGLIPVEDDFTIPLDSYIDFQFEKSLRYEPVNQNTLVTKYGIIQGANNEESLPPQPSGITTQVTHSYFIENITLSYWNGTSWAIYDPAVAVHPVANAALYGYVPDLPSPMIGMWQWKGILNNNLRIAATTPFDYQLRATSIIPPDQLGVKESNITCALDAKEKHCLFFDLFPFNELKVKTLRSHLGANLKIYGSAGKLEVSQAYNRNKALLIPYEASLLVFFEEPSTNISVHLGNQGISFTIRFFRNVISDLRNPDGTEIVVQTEVHSITSSANIEDFTMPDKTGIDYFSITSNEPSCGDFILAETSDFIISETSVKIITEDSDSSACSLKLYEVYWQTVFEYDYNLSLPAQDDVNLFNEQLIGNLSKRVLPVWRPNTIYKIEVVTLDKVEGIVFRRPNSFLFRTAGPIGNFHQYSPTFKSLPAPAEEIYPLASLKNYIDNTRSYPNADGNIINAKPLYYANPKLTLFFNSNYVYTMFNNFQAYGNLPLIKSSIEVQIVDPTESKNKEGIDGSSYLPANQLPPTAKKWRRADKPLVPANVQLISNIINGLQSEGKNCSGDVEPVDLKPLQLALDLDGFELLPSKAYLALFQADYSIGNNPTTRNEVHKYIFQTSKYENFETHIKSCNLEIVNNVVTPRAVFTMEIPLNNLDFDAFRKVLNYRSDQPDSLIAAYADPYDRIFDGILKIKTLSPAVGTEFNIIINPSGQNYILLEDNGFILLEDDNGILVLEDPGSEILGVIVRSDEPLADPKIIESTSDPIELTLNDVLRIKIDNGSYSESTTVFSKDKSNAFISNKWLHLQPGLADFKFAHILYNGDRYAQLEEEHIAIDLSLVN